MSMCTEEKISKAVYLPVSNIRPNPYQPRKEMNSEAMEDLCASIKQYGLMQPVVVRPVNDNDFELIAGERRLRACKMLGLLRIPAIVIRAGGTDSAVMALIENIQRENLGYIEEAEAFCSLLSEHGITQEQLAEKLGKKQSTIANKIRILKLSGEVRALLAEHNLSERHARALLRLPEERDRLKVLNMVICRGLNVAKTEEIVDAMLNPGRVENETGKNIRVFRDVRIFANTIRQAVEMMKKSGVQAFSTKVENEDFIEYTIKIPKNSEKAV